MKKTALIVFFLSVMHFAKGQISTPELITDRPDQTESASVVPFRNLQIETGFIYESDREGANKTETYTYNTTLIRYGLFENFELRLGVEVLGSKFSNSSIGLDENISGFGPLYTGFKIHLRDENGFVPELALLGEIVSSGFAKDEFKPDGAVATMRFAFAHTLSDRFSVGYNIALEFDVENVTPYYLYTLVFGVGMTEKLSGFVEVYGMHDGHRISESLFDAGLTYLLLPNLQLDCSSGFGLSDYAMDNFISLGLSYRLPE